MLENECGASVDLERLAMMSKVGEQISVVGGPPTEKITAAFNSMTDMDSIPEGRGLYNLSNTEISILKLINNRNKRMDDLRITMPKLNLKKLPKIKRTEPVAKSFTQRIKSPKIYKEKLFTARAMSTQITEILALETKARKQTFSFLQSEEANAPIELCCTYEEEEEDEESEEQRSKQAVPGPVHVTSSILKPSLLERSLVGAQSNHSSKSKSKIIVLAKHKSQHKQPRKSIFLKKKKINEHSKMVRIGGPTIRRIGAA